MTKACCMQLSSHVSEFRDALDKRLVAKTNGELHACTCIRLPVPRLHHNSNHSICPDRRWLASGENDLTAGGGVLHYTYPVDQPHLGLGQIVN
ncbi:hypothetical protein GUJ93_ZPchr0002g23172 [Zizania palustris]|uniref:Uncharacterized protein n=1 Tax=Zizania palustris TaxID=103762 RepID=A0A8J5V525_ZIZPA|nr:hypothetical protein GUJ93_ZPchr0002g23172 [Zizania palustris]